MTNPTRRRRYRRNLATGPTVAGMANPPVSPWCNPAEAAARLGISVRTLAKMGDAGDLTMMRTLGGGQRRYARDEVDDLVARQLAPKKDAGQ